MTVLELFLSLLVLLVCCPYFMTCVCYLSYSSMYPFQDLLRQPQNYYLILSLTIAVPYPWTDFGKAVNGLFSVPKLDSGVLAPAMYLMVGMLVGFLIFF